jgi:prepilin-type N-terminal cleavage/methylation domain-containing protein
MSSSWSTPDSMPPFAFCYWVSDSAGSWLNRETKVEESDRIGPDRIAHLVVAFRHRIDSRRVAVSTDPGTGHLPEAVDAHPGHRRALYGQDVWLRLLTRRNGPGTPGIHLVHPRDPRLGMVDLSRTTAQTGFRCRGEDRQHRFPSHSAWTTGGKGGDQLRLTRQGFSLIELMIVMAILFILAAILVP